jgi:hypothetical protein
VNKWPSGPYDLAVRLSAWLISRSASMYEVPHLLQGSNVGFACSNSRTRRESCNRGFRLTHSIKLNTRLSLRRHDCTLSSLVPDIAQRPGCTQGKAVTRSYSAWWLCFLKVAPMLTSGRDYVDQTLQPKAAWAEVWHLWTVIIPRRSITGRLVRGRVWRRHDGRHWIYKKFVEYKKTD